MNIQKFIITTALIAAAGSAFADNRYPIDAPFVSTKTRAEVVAELPQAGNQARVNYNSSIYPVLQAAASTKTRAEVRAELAAANANHELDAFRHNGGN